MEFQRYPLKFHTKTCKLFATFKVGLKRYVQPTIRYIPQYICHSYLGSRGLWYQPVIWSTALHRLQLRSGYNNGGLLGVFRCSVFVMNSLILLEYTDCFPWYLMFVYNFGMCYICTVSYRIVIRAYRHTYHSLCIGDIPVYRFSPISKDVNFILRWQFKSWLLKSFQHRSIFWMTMVSDRDQTIFGTCTWIDRN